MEHDTLLEVSGLTVRYPGSDAPALRDVSMTLEPGAVNCVIGESGSGKSTLLNAIMQLPGRVEIISGSVRLHGRDLRTLTKAQMSRMRGGGIGVVFQEPGASLDPIRKIWRQFYDTLRAHDPGVTKAEARRLAGGILECMEFKDTDRILDSCPAQLSGGMNQRVAIALAMVLEPEILLCDEPTSALDVTVQAQIIQELLRLRDQYGTSIVLITHNMGVVAETADMVAVMYCGRIVEYGTLREVLHEPAHPYTRALLEAIPRLDGRMPKGIPGKRSGTLPGTGCAFAPRCPHERDACTAAVMEKKQITGEHWTLCPEVL